MSATAHVFCNALLAFQGHVVITNDLMTTSVVYNLCSKVRACLSNQKIFSCKVVFKRVFNVKQALMKEVVTSEESLSSAFFCNLFSAFLGQKTVFNMATKQTGVEKSLSQICYIWVELFFYIVKNTSQSAKA